MLKIHINAKIKNIKAPVSNNHQINLTIMRKKVFPLVLLLFLFASCGNKSKNQIEEDISSGVVLVQNQSYYEVILPNNESLYFSGFDEDGNLKGLALEEDSVEVTTSYGTGFFISKTGEIVTNAHVVTNTVEDKETTKSVDKILKALKYLYVKKYEQLDESYNEAQRAYDYANTSSEVSYEDFYKIRDLRDAIGEERDEYAKYYYAINEIRASDSEVKYHNAVSIAYNDTYVTNTKDFSSCVITKTDSEHDLAIIQLKDKKSPEGKHIFEVTDEDPLETYSITESITNKISDDKNSELYMVSFNLGPKLALTKDGIKSQFNSGSISQRSKDRLMYSIPALPGSSGSPVVNREEQLVAINYAGLNGTQSFNYGIRQKYLKALINR